MDICLVPGLVLCTFISKSLQKDVLLFLLGIYIRMKRQGHMVSVCLIYFFNCQADLQKPMQDFINFRIFDMCLEGPHVGFKLHLSNDVEYLLAFLFFIQTSFWLE